MGNKQSQYKSNIADCSDLQAGDVLLFTGAHQKNRTGLSRQRRRCRQQYDVCLQRKGEGFCTMFGTVGGFPTHLRLSWCVLFKILYIPGSFQPVRLVPHMGGWLRHADAISCSTYFGIVLSVLLTTYCSQSGLCCHMPVASLQNVTFESVRAEYVRSRACGGAVQPRTMLHIAACRSTLAMVKCVCVATSQPTPVPAEFTLLAFRRSKPS